MEDVIANFEKLSDEKRTLISKIAKTWLIKGEDPSEVVKARHLHSSLSEQSSAAARSECLHYRRQE